MKKFKLNTLLIGIIFLSTSTVFASWWNPFTWFQKMMVSVQQLKQNPVAIIQNFQKETSSSTYEYTKDNLQIYVNYNFGYRIEYPLNWTIDSEKRIMDDVNKIESLVKIYDTSHEHGVIITVNQKDSILKNEAPATEKVIIDGVPQVAYLFPEGYECHMRNPNQKDCSFFIIPINHNGLWYEIKIIGEAKNVSEAHKKILSTFKFVNVSVSNPLKIEKTGLYVSTSTNKLIFTESDKIIKYKYTDFSCGYYEKLPNCKDNILAYDSYKGSKIYIKDIEYIHVGPEKQKVTQTFDIDVATFTFVDNYEKEVDKIIKYGGMSKTTLVSSSNYEEMRKSVNGQATPDNPINFKYLIGQDVKNGYYLTVTRYGCGGDAIGCVGNIYLEQISNKEYKKISKSTLHVDGMNKYIDDNFGFSFWYPDNLSVKELSGNIADSETSFGKNTKAIKRINVGDVNILEVYSSDMSINAATLDQNGFLLRYFFDKSKDTWMVATGVTSKGDPASTTTVKISNSTMGGLPIFNGYERFGIKSIVPISTNNFLVVTAKCNDATDYACGSGLGTGRDRYEKTLKTIVAIDPSVAVPVSESEQINIIKEEQSSYPFP